MKSTASAAWWSGRSSRTAALLLIENLFDVEFAVRNADVRINRKHLAVGGEPPELFLLEGRALKFAAALDDQHAADPLRRALGLAPRDFIDRFLAIRRVRQFAGNVALRTLLRGGGDQLRTGMIDFAGHA